MKHIAATVVTALLISPIATAQLGGAGYVSNTFEISQCTLGVFPPIQGNSGAGIGDLDGDGIPDLATQYAFDQDVVAIHFLTSAGAIRETALFGQGGLGGFEGEIQDLDRFSDELAALGDFDGDGVFDILVGHDQDDDGSGLNAGACWIVLLNPDGTVKDEHKISALSGGLTVPPGNQANFGNGLASIGDLNGDGITDIAVGAPGTSQVATSGVVHILLMNQDGTVQQQTVLGLLGSTLGEQIPIGNVFGASLACIGDLDGDGVQDLAVGARGGLFHSGSVWILFLTPNGGVKDFVEITDGTPGFGANLKPLDEFGWETTSLGDLNGDGFTDIAVSASLGDLAGIDVGEVYVLFLDAAGGVVDWTVFTQGLGGFGTQTIGGFGASIDVLSGGDGSGDLVLAVGSGVACPFPAPAQFFLTLDDGQRAITYDYGNSINPPGSLQVLSGVPALGTSVQIGVDNPLGTQGPGGFPFVVLSLQPDLNFPNGTPLPGFGMAGSGASGELLLSLSSADLISPALVGPTWAGTGQPSTIDLAIPSDSSLLGLHVYCQGVIPDPNSGSSGVRFGLSEGLQFRFGP